MKTPMRSPSIIPADVLRLQGEVSDPTVSAWVAANAGSGKTHVLAQRVINLLLAGVAPEKILCLTFTKAAAANMAASRGPVSFFMARDHITRSARGSRVRPQAPMPSLTRISWTGPRRRATELMARRARIRSMSSP